MKVQFILLLIVLCMKENSLWNLRNICTVNFICMCFLNHSTYRWVKTSDSTKSERCVWNWIFYSLYVFQIFCLICNH
jgi:hypothetical protein